MKTLSIIAALAILPLAAQAYNFAPRSTHYTLPATFHFTINGVTTDCPTQLRGSTTPKGQLRIDGNFSKCLAVENLPRIALASGPGTGFLNMTVSYQSTLCGGGSDITVSKTGGFVLLPTSNGACTFSADGQFSPVISIVGK